MPTETEVGLRVEDFMGINRQVASEDIQDYYFKTIQNMWERKIGEIEPTGGSSNLTNTTPPSNITTFGKTKTLYDKILGKTKIMKVFCTDQGRSDLAAANITMSFVTDVANGKWGTAGVGITNAYIGAAEIWAVAAGFGVYRKVGTVLNTSMPISGDTKKLRVVISSPFADTNITTIQLFAKVIGAYPVAPAEYEFIWIGQIDLVATPSGTFDFNNGPITLGADPGNPQEIGDTDTTFTLTPTNVGSLTPGKTYYVAVMQQWLKYGPGQSDDRVFWRTTSVTAITLLSGQTSISVAKTGGGSAATLIAVGLHPQLLTPIGVVSQGATFTYSLTSIPAQSVGVVNLIQTGASTSMYLFRAPDIGVDDMFCKISGTSWVPIFINNHRGLNANGYWGVSLGSASGSRPWQDDANAFGTVTSNAKYTFDQYNNQKQDLLYGCGRGTINLLDQGGIDSARQYNLVQTDGRAAGMAVFDYGTAAPPPFSYIKFFKERAVGGGGPGDTYNRAYFSLAFNPYNWGVPGAISTAQYVQVESGGEELTGIGVYTNTSGTSGPISQALFAKRNSVFILTDMPTYTSSSFNNTTMTQLSKKVGCVNNDTILNTDIGTIMTSENNVWLVRETGEPVPLGHEISNLLRPEDPSVTVDNSNWNAVVHNGCYKLAYSQGNSAVPDQEIWLNLNKMKLLKGQSCWYGPHTGKEIWSSDVEEQFLDTIQPKRICVDVTNKRWYRADNPSVTQDFGANRTYSLAFRNYPLGDPNANKLFTRMYWKMKVDQDLAFTEATTVLSEDGETTETITRTASKLTGYVSSDFAHFASSCRAKIYQFFPVLRLRGENITRTFTYTGVVLFAITGFTQWYKTERRHTGL